MYTPEQKYWISLFRSETDTGYANTRKEVSLRDLARTIVAYTWSPSVFAPDGQGRMHRHVDNFEAASLLVLDVDEGCSLEDAKKAFAGFLVLMATSRHHQKQKRTASGKVYRKRSLYGVIDFFADRDPIAEGSRQILFSTAVESDDGPRGPDACPRVVRHRPGRCRDQFLGAGSPR